MVIKDEEDTFETKEGDVTYLNILTYRHYTFTDFNDNTKSITNKINQEKYTIICIIIN